MDNHSNSFESVTELAEYLNISRKTLYQRSKKHNIALSGKYTNDEIKTLSSKVSPTVSNPKGNSKQSKVTIESDTILELKRQIDSITADKIFLQSELQTKNNQIDQLNKQVDQAQQLQLIAEQRLTEERQKVIELSETQAPQKGFWSRLFGN